MIAIGAFFMTAALVMDRNIQTGADSVTLFLGSMESVTVVSLLLFVLFYRLLEKAVKLAGEESKSAGEKLCSILPAVFFAFCMVMGYSYYQDNSWNLVFGNKLQFLKSGFAMIGYVLLFWSCIICLFHYFENQKNLPALPKFLSEPLRIYKGCLEKYPFRTVFFSLFILYLPYMVYSYPGIFTSDTKNQLGNGYLALAYADEPLRNHHPVAHTLTIRFFTWIGETLFSSANAGIFLAALTQSLLLFAAVAWMAVLLRDKKVPAKGITLVMLFYVISPRIRNFMFLLVKDSYFAAFLLLFLTEFYRVLTEEPGFLRRQKKHLFLLILSMLGVMLYRQDGVYVLFLSWLFVFLLDKRRRKLAGGLAVGVLSCSLLYTNVLLPACQVVPSNPREMLSIPFQQTARYILYAGDEVTEEEREAIDAILDYDSLAELYNPNLSDRVKATYDKDSGTEALKEYFRVWFQMFLKHPDIYLQATFNNVYGYFYPAGYSTECFSYEKSGQHMEDINEMLADFGTDFHYPEAFAGVRIRLENLREEIFKLPVLSSLNLTACYTWAVIFLLFYCLKTRKKSGALLLGPLLTVILICVAGPIYGWYFRYMYSAAVCLPGAAALIWSDRKNA